MSLNKEPAAALQRTSVLALLSITKTIDNEIQSVLQYLNYVLYGR
ncbi:hypothetical protein UFOVP402_37 [uncultured Caudovirales phage]|uniref:Uncharacterized protein n=1 Tax=uncultured Caudovirales phage TaxID=2100421 RepID=A0A6J5M191_9CAUD|nr:hypothetical protein UFOVP402_37 [uncultured Caudovirales phage]